MNTADKPLAELMGDGLTVPVFGGGAHRYVNLDNAATTPPLRRVWDRLAELMPWYGSIHRGDGLKSIISTQVLEQARERILRFADGSADRDVLLIGQNTTACINHLARRLSVHAEFTVVTSELEHSSNILAWRKHAAVLQCPTSTAGQLDLDELRRLLAARHVNIVAVTAASSITGAIVDVHRIAAVAHAYGAQVFVDAAQLVAHRKLLRGEPEAADHIDFVAFAGHKMYAPFGAAALVGPRDAFIDGWPDQPGGGSVSLIEGDELIWAGLPAREQGGSPNYPGIVALAEACAGLEEIGFDRIAEHERGIRRHASEVLGGLSGLTSYGQLGSTADEHVPVFPFNVEGFDHALVASYLGTERAIGVRSGPICQYELIARLLQVTGDERKRVQQQVAAGDQRSVYGVVRASCGLGSTTGDIDDLGAALRDLIRNGTTAKYEQSLDGRYHAIGWSPTLPEQLSVATSSTPR